MRRATAFEATAALRQGDLVGYLVVIVTDLPQLDTQVHRLLPELKVALTRAGPSASGGTTA